MSFLKEVELQNQKAETQKLSVTYHKLNAEKRKNLIEKSKTEFINFFKEHNFVIKESGNTITAVLNNFAVDIKLPDLDNAQFTSNGYFELSHKGSTMKPETYKIEMHFQRKDFGEPEDVLPNQNLSTIEGQINSEKSSQEFYANRISKIGTVNYRFFVSLKTDKKSERTEYSNFDEILNKVFA